MAKNEIMLPQSKELTEYKGKVLEVQKAANALQIKNAKDLEVADELLTRISQGEKLITSRKEEITRPLMVGLKSIRDLFKSPEQGFADAKRTVKTKMLGYEAEESARIALETARTEARVAKGTMRADTAASKLEKIGTGPAMNTRTLEKVRVIDESLIPREWLTPDLTRITIAILKEGVEIPGVEKYEEKVMVTKRSI